MRAGRLRQLIELQHEVAGSPQRTPSGEFNSEWDALLENEPAEWITLNGSSLFAAQQHHADIRGIWRIRWPAVTVRASMRILNDGLYYQILWVPPYDKKGKRIELDLECSEGVVAPA